MDFKVDINVIKEGNRYFIPITEDILKEKKGQIYIDAKAGDIEFECRLIPKGNGRYYIPLKKALMEKISNCGKKTITCEVISQLTRINKDSPYSTKRPVRKINRIDIVMQPKRYLCMQCSIAMLSGKPLQEVANLMNAKPKQASFSMMIEALDYYGIAHANKMIYTRGKSFTLPKCCILNTRTSEENHYNVYYDGKYYDSSLGILESYDYSLIVGYYEIYC